MFRAKMTVESITCELVRFRCLYSPDNPEDNSFSKWTPSGLVDLHVTNPDVMSQIVVGKQFYVDFTEIR